MSGSAPGSEVEGVEAEAVAAIGRMRPGPVLGGAGHAGSLAAAYRTGGGGERVAVLDLDERKTAAAHGDEVQFAIRRAGAARDDAVALGMRYAAAMYSATRPRRSLRRR